MQKRHARKPHRVFEALEGRQMLGQIISPVNPGADPNSPVSIVIGAVDPIDMPGFGNPFSVVDSVLPESPIGPGSFPDIPLMSPVEILMC